MAAVLLVYQDLQAARERFVTWFGFDEILRIDGPHGEPVRFHVSLGTTVLLLGEVGAHGLLPPVMAGAQTHLLVVNVGNVDTHWARAQAAADVSIAAVVDQPWGREYEIVDPEGYTVSFVE